MTTQTRAVSRSANAMIGAANALGIVLMTWGLVWTLRSWSAPRGHYVSVLGWFLLAVGSFALSRTRPSASEAVRVVWYLGLAYFYSVRSEDFSRPPFLLKVIGVAVLVGLLSAALPNAIVMVRRLRDERERKIILGAMAAGFVAMMTAGGGAVVVSQYSSSVHLDNPGLGLLVIGVAVWFGATFVLKRRM